MGLRETMRRRLRVRSHRLYRQQRRVFERAVAIEPLEVRLMLAAVRWDGGGDRMDWHDPANWDSDTVPGPLDDAIVDRPGEYSVGVSADAHVNSLRLGGDSSYPRLTLYDSELASAKTHVQYGATLVLRNARLQGVLENAGYAIVHGKSSLLAYDDATWGGWVNIAADDESGDAVLTLDTEFTNRSLVELHVAGNLPHTASLKVPDGRVINRGTIRASGNLDGQYSIQAAVVNLASLDVYANLTISDDLQNDGVVQICNQGPLTVSGAFAQSDVATLSFASYGFGGPAVAAGQLTVSQSASIAGQLQLSLPASPRSSQPVVILSAESVSGQFQHVQGLHIGGGSVYTLERTATQLLLHPPPLRDLAVTSVSAPRASSLDAPLVVEWTVENQGADMLRRASWADVIYLSSDGTLSDAPLRYLASSETGELSLASGDSYTRSLALQPAQLWSVAPGDYFLMVAAQPYGAELESNRENNVASVPLTLLPFELDLQASQITAPASIMAGEGFSVNWTVTNLGATSTLTPFEDVVYLTQDGTLDTIIAHLGSVHIQDPLPLDTGQSYDARLSVSEYALGSYVPPGSYFLTVTADGFRTLSDALRANNLRSKPVEIVAPDLVVTAAEVSPVAEVGQAVTATWTVQNQGQVRAQGYWQDAFYLSSDDQYGGNDIYLGAYHRWAPVPLAPQMDYTRREQFAIPADAPGGQQFILIVADGGWQFRETNEDNNVWAVPIRVDVPDVPEFNVSVATVEAPTSAASGDTLHVAWTVSLEGFVPADAWWAETVYVSRDETIDGSDSLVASTYNYDIWNMAECHGYRKEVDARLPGTLEAGDYYLIVTTNGWNRPAETNPADNVYAVPLHVELADLAMYQGMAPASLAVGESFDMLWTVANPSTTAAQGSWRDAVYLSRDDVWDPFDLLVNSFVHNGALAPSDSYTSTQRVAIPSGTPLGSQYVIVVTDYDGQRRELSEANNVAVVPIELTGADLEPVSIMAPSEVTLGQPFDVAWTVRNNSAQAGRGYWSDCLYLSDDQQLDEGDLVLAVSYRSDPVLAGASYTWTAPQVNAYSFLAGDKYLILKADSYRQLAEWEEADNVLVQSITLTESDLAVSASSASGVAAVGESFNVTWTVRNVGATEAVATWKDRVLLSRDTSPSFDDVTLVEASGNDDEALAVQASYEIAGTIATPVSTQPGDYFLLFVTDADHAIPERHESNNVARVPLTLLAPDLHLTSLESVESVAVGRELFVEWTVANPASVRTFGTWEDVLLLSDDPYPGTADTVLASMLATTPVDAGGQYSQSASVTIPASVVPGNKYLLLRVDGQRVLGESDEANNYLSIPIRLLGSDLLVSSHTFPAEGLLGTEAEFRWTVTNTEQLPAVSGWDDSLYLSWDDRWDSGDIHLASQYRSNAPPLAAGACYEVVVSANLRDVEPGLRYLIVRIDTSGSLGEVDEANNTLVVPIALHAPDLVVQDAWAPPAVYAGQNIHITWTTLNNSPYDALAGWSDSLYLSQDAWFDNSDRHVATYSAYDRVPLVAGDDYTCQRSIRIPSDTRAGVWYLVVVTDDWSGQWETNEYNNERILPLEVSVPDLVLVDAFTPAAAATGATIDVSWTVRNSSSVPAVVCWSDAVYVSSDPMLDSSDQLLTDFHFCDARLGAGESYDVSRTVAVPGTTPGGDKYLLVMTDNFRAQAEADEKNNLFAVPISIRTPDLAVRALEAPSEIVLGQQVSLAWTVENVGEVGALADWSDDLVISDDPVFSWDDRWLATAGAGSYTPLDPRGSYTIRQSVIMPVDLNPGDKYLLLLVDHWGYQAETSEGNNVLAMPFRLQGPDLQPLQLDCPDTAVVDQTVTFSWTVANQGLPSVLGSWTDTIYISADDRLDYGDQWVGSVYRPAAPVDAGHSYQLSGSFRLDNVGVGEKYVILAVDTYHGHGETNEANNVLVRSITLEAPDLAVMTVEAPSVLALGTSFPLTWTVTNVGDVAAYDDWIDAVFLAAGKTRDTVLSQVATETTSAQTPLAAGGNYTISRSLTVYGYMAGANYLLVVADSYDAQGEVTESNNAFAIPITLTAPDLVVTDMTAPESAHVGETVEVAWTVANRGNQPATVAWSDELSLSTSTYFMTGSGIVATVSAVDYVPLDPDESYTHTQHVTIPETVGYYPVAAAGDRYLVLATNRAQLPPEMTCTNNQWYLPLRIESADVDLVPDGHTIPDTWTVDQTSLVSWTVINPGFDPGRSQWVDRVYLSNDALLDWQDTLLASVNVAPNPLAAGGSYTQTAQTLLPWWAGGGTKYILVKIDADNGQSETDENNNLLVVPITVTAPNLIVTDVTAPHAAVLGEVIHVVYTVLNAGTVPASASWVDAIYLSGDEGRGNDVLLDDYDTPGVGRPVPPGESFVYERDVEIRNMRSGDRFLLVVTDLENDQAETDESDNFHAAPIRITAPDLVVSAATAPATALSESTITISYTVTNEGDGPALAAWRDRVYLSRSPFFDGTLDSGDTLVAEFAADPQLPLAADGYYTHSEKIALPGTAAGDRYLLFVTDADQQQRETNEHNNLWSVAIRIYVDLTLALDPASDSGAPADRLTNTSPIRLVGTAEPLCDVQLDVLGDGSVDVTSVADSDGRFAFEDLPLAQGQNRFVARGLSDGQANGVPLEITLDQERPWGALLYPGPGSVVLEDPGYVELQWYDTGAAGLDVTTYSLSDIAVTGVTIDRMEVVGDQRVRYWYTDDGDALSTNSVTVMQIAGEVADRAGNINQTARDVFSVAASSLSGHVYLDVNDNGIMDPVELRLPNVPVTIHGPLQRTVLTDDSGFYEFTGLPPGVYTLTEAQPSAFLDGSDRMGAPGVGAMLNDRCENIALTGSMHLEGYDFGERGLRPELISKALFLASTPAPGRLAATLSVPNNRGWLTFTADRDAIVSMAVLQTTQPAIELYTSDFMPRAITTGYWLLNAPVFDGQSYIVHVAGSSDVLQLAMAMTDNTGQDFAPHANGVFTNPALCRDVNADGMVTPLDALLVINELNRFGPHCLLGPNYAPPFLDVAHDGCVSPIDALVVINYLNTGSAGEGEADATGDSTAGSAGRVIDLPTDLVIADFDRSVMQIWRQPRTPLKIAGVASTSGKRPPPHGQLDSAALPACPVGHAPTGRAEAARGCRRWNPWMTAPESLAEGLEGALCDIAEDVASSLGADKGSGTFSLASGSE